MGRDVPMTRLLFAALVFAGACAWRGPVPAQTYSDIEPSSDVITLDKAAYKLVAVQNKKIERTEDGRLSLRLELSNLSELDLPVQVRTLWRDGDGMPTKDATPFEMLVLPGNSSKLYETASLTNTADSFTVEIKTP